MSRKITIVMDDREQRSGALDARHGNVEEARVAYHRILERAPGHLEAITFVTKKSKVRLPAVVNTMV